ncbi:restriction endonuclease subunit S [Candidatus Saccharibacteria bacterium]|nr:restriction endonuclease subunit S [Candidatus Saccharibacteria bacterium]
MDWPLVRLDELYEIARGGSPRPIKKFLTDDPDGINWIKIGDATASGKYIYETKEKIIPEGKKRSRFVNEGDFLLSNSMSFGRPYIMATTGCIHDGWLVLSPKDDQVDQDFLYYLLGSPFVFQQFDSLAAGSTVRNLNIDLVSGVKIPLLPLEEQKRIVAILNQAFADIDKARALTEQNLKNARELFESYLQQVFSQRREGWKTSKLKSIASKIGSGATPKGGKAAYKAEGISLIRSMNVHDRRFLEKDLAFIDDDQAEKLSNVVVEKNDVLLNITGASVARCALAPEQFLPARVNQHVSIIRVNQKELLPAFLNYALTSKFYKDQLLGIGESGSTRQAITKQQIEYFEVSYPLSIDQQTRYVQQLMHLESQVNEVQCIYEKKLDSLDELKKSVLQKAFVGELKKDNKEAAA